MVNKTMSNLQKVTRVSNLKEATTISNSDVLLVETATETLKVTKGNLLKEVNEELNAKSDANHTHDEYVTESELNSKGLATEMFVTNKIAEAQLGNNGGNMDLSGYATTEYVDQEVGKTNAQLSQVNNDLTIFNYKTQSFVTPEQFGAVGDGIADDTEAIQRASDNCKAGQKLLFGANKKYKISDTIIFYRTNVIDGNGCFIMIDGNFKEGSRFAFEYHHTSNSNNILDTFIMGNEIKNFNIQHYGNLEGEFYNGIYVAENCHVKNIYTWGLNKVVEVTSKAYIDFVTIEDINIWGKWGDDYAINTGFMGDARVVKNIHFTPVDASNYNVLKVGNGHNTCRIEGIVNGNIEVGKSLVDISNLHIEVGTITLKDTRGSIREVFMWCPADGINPIVMNGEVNIVLENCFFNYYAGSKYDYINGKFNEIKLNRASANLKIKNCFKNMLPTEAITFLNPAGITIENYDDINNNSLCNSLESTIVNGRCVPLIMPADRSDATYDIFGAFYTDGNFKWGENSGTYFYKAVLVFDEKRKIGQTRKSNEINKNLTNGGSCPYINLNGNMNSNLKVYRGTTSNTYDKFAIVGIRSGYLHDNGHIVNGVKWNDRNASDIDNYLEAYKYILHNNGTVTISAAGTPTAGKWEKGDRIENSNPIVGYPKSWIFDGSTWLSEGNL